MSSFRLFANYKTSGFLMGFLKKNHYCTQLFYGQNYFGTLFLVFLKFTICAIIVNHLWKTYICGIESALYFLFHMGKCMICYLLVWKRLASLIKFLRIDFIDLLHYLQNLKMF